MLTISSEISGAVVRFTLDGTEPTESSQIFTESFLVDKSSDLVVRVYKDNHINSDLVV